MTGVSRAEDDDDEAVDEVRSVDSDSGASLEDFLQPDDVPVVRVLNPKEEYRRTYVCEENCLPPGSKRQRRKPVTFVEEFAADVLPTYLEGMDPAVARQILEGDDADAQMGVSADAPLPAPAPTPLFQGVSSVLLTDIVVASAPNQGDDATDATDGNDADDDDGEDDDEDPDADSMASEDLNSDGEEDSDYEEGDSEPEQEGGDAGDGADSEGSRSSTSSPLSTSFSGSSSSSLPPVVSDDEDDQVLPRKTA